MKKLTAILALLLFVYGCGSPNKFASGEHGLQITFPCAYKKAENNTYGCQDENYLFGVTFRDKPLEDLGERKASYEKKIKFQQEDEERYTHDRTKKFKLNETTISGFSTLEFEEEEYFRDNLIKISKTLHIFKAGGEISVNSYVKADDSIPAQVAEQHLKKQTKSFFDSLELTKNAE